MSTPRILVTAPAGQVGWELRRTLAPLGEVVAAGRSGPLALDLADPDRIRAVVREVRPDLVVNAAAYTAVDKAEEERELAMAVNATAPGILAEEAARLGAPLIHYSTDYVFDGTKGTPYVEDDAPNPVNVYGESKLAGERAVQEAGGAAVILRTSWVYGLRGRNFLLTMRRLAAEKAQLNIVDDQIASPTWSRMIAETTAAAVARAGVGGLQERAGLYHLAAAGETSWCGFARRIFELMAEREGATVPVVQGLPTADYPTPARRPLYTKLDCGKFEQAFGARVPGWGDSLTLCLEP